VVDQQDTIAEGKGVNLIFQAPDDSFTVMASEEGLNRIFTNLIGNAVKYTPAEGQVKVAVNKSSSNVAIKISDTGIGIPQDGLPHLWEEFFRAKNARRSGIKGTGLGLSIVKQYVDQFGGQIEVNSVEGEGTTFKLILPLV
jgi:signal transduction histidine kinase